MNSQKKLILKDSPSLYLLRKRLIILISLSVALIILTLKMNQWATKEIQNITNNAPIERHSVAKTTPLKLPTAAGHPVIIDPDNDPLAPVVKKIPQTLPKSSHLKGRPQKMYESPLNEVIIAQ